MKVKVFEARPQGSEARVDAELEQSMNAWLADHQDIVVVDVRTAVVPAIVKELPGSLVCMLFYEDKSGPGGDRRAGFLGFTR